MFEKWIVPAIGVGAFIVGGLVAQQKGIEIAQVVQKVFSDEPKVS